MIHSLKNNKTMKKACTFYCLYQISQFITNWSSLLDPDTSVRLQEGGGAHKALVTGSVKYFWSIEIVSVKNRVTW